MHKLNWQITLTDLWLVVLLAWDMCVCYENGSTNLCEKVESIKHPSILVGGGL